VTRLGLRDPRKEKKKVALQKIPGQLEASFLIFLTLVSIKKATHKLEPKTKQKT